MNVVHDGQANFNLKTNVAFYELYLFLLACKKMYKSVVEKIAKTREDKKNNIYINNNKKKMYFIREADWKFNIKVYNIWYKTIIYVFQ